MQDMAPYVHEEVKGMNYELVYIINPTVEEEARKELIARFNGMIETNGGTVDKVDEWGKRRLAYPINDLPEGYYVLMNCECKPELPAELDRVFKITDGILRSIIVAVEE